MADFALDDKYLRDEGTIALSGVQALVRLPIDQHKADQRAGLNTATFISGYRGSPLGGYDLLLESNRTILRTHQVTFVPGINEDLGATAVFGSQLANQFPDPKFDGVLGIWYGKGPGVDRSGDAFKHANLTGVGRTGGVLAIAGDDPASKSSTVPSASEVALFDAQIPVLYPGDVQEVIDLGSAGFALSRYSGLWVGLKVVTNVADEFGTAVVSPERHRWVHPTFEYHGKPWQPNQSHTMFAPYNLQLEQEVWEGRLEAARRFAAVNHLNTIPVNPTAARFGIAAAGKTYFDVREALDQLGLSTQDLETAGIRLLKVGMLYPLEPEIVRTFARGLEEVLVVEEKRSFLELLLRDVLYNEAERPKVVGKYDDAGRPLVPGHGELDADIVAGIILDRLCSRLPTDAAAKARTRLASAVPSSMQPMGLPAQRLAYFCSGCPHNRSTVVPEGSIAAAGIGCHGMAITMDRVGAGFTQMGAEGAQWVGASYFTNTPHIFQNIGDGTLFHSGTLAIRQAVASGASITYKILYNGAVAMTGGQAVDGVLPVPELTRELEAEGVKRILVLTDEPDRYRGVALARGVECWPRERLDEAQRLFRTIPGVTVLIYDQHCAADLRRKRKRGLAPERPMRVFINERICEGCGDCGVKSNCLSVAPVETEFGRKTRIHQSSCNTDYSCLEGHCPAFVSVVPGAKVERKPTGLGITLGDDIPVPSMAVGTSANLYCMGIGGTGVVTVNQILGTAAALEGKTVRCLDQTGLSQKGGAVVSHLKISAGPTNASNKVGLGEADAYIGFDVLTAADNRHLTRARPDRTVAVVSSSHVPTGLMVRNAAVEFPADSALHARIDSVTRAKDNLYLDAEALAEFLFGSHLPANLIVVGAVFQKGLIPVAAASIERAIRLNGAGAEANIQAFRAGRRLVADPAWIGALGSLRVGDQAPVTTAPSAEIAAMVAGAGASGELARLLGFRTADLAAYQDPSYARSYADFVTRVARRERELGLGTALAESVARYLYKLMAYKDEYEVARLSLDPAFPAAIDETFGPGARVSYRLQPPALRAFGLHRKISLGRWFDPVFKLLRAGRRLRGTAFDPFGRDEVRRTERALIGEYRDLIETELTALAPATIERAIKLARLPDMIRGYDHVKLANVTRFRAEVARLTAPAPIPERVTASV